MTRSAGGGGAVYGEARLGRLLVHSVQSAAAAPAAAVGAVATASSRAGVGGVQRSVLRACVRSTLRAVGSGPGDGALARQRCARPATVRSPGNGHTQRTVHIAPARAHAAARVDSGDRARTPVAASAPAASGRLLRAPSLRCVVAGVHARMHARRHQHKSVGAAARVARARVRRLRRPAQGSARRWCVRMSGAARTRRG